MINKSMYDINGNDVNIGVLFTKIDRENRTVSGFATLDNRDDHGDVVSADGSRSAFSRFRGGLREMHQPISVGKLLNFEEMKKYDPDTDAVYDGVYVKAYVSKGANDTWEKVLDGTLKGFSIGGKVKRKSIGVGEDGDEYMIIDDYDLIELSLVDNPANPLASVVTVQKIGDRFVYEDDALEKQVLNILISEESGDVILSEDEERDGFTNIGWTDSPDNVDKIKYSLHEWQSSEDDTEKSVDASDTTDLLEDAGGDTISNQEGGATMGTKTKEEETVEEVEATDTEKSADETVESASEDTTTETEVEETEEEEVEKAAEVSEVEEDATEEENEIVSKVVEAITPLVTKAADAAKESSNAVEDVKSSFDKTLDEKISELQKSFKDDLDSLAERVEAVESDTAVKKSADIVENDDDDEEDNDEEESIWRGSFLSADALTKG